MDDKFKKWLKEERKISELTAINYASHVNVFHRTHGDNLNKVREFILSNPTPLRKTALIRYLEYKGNDKASEEYKDIKVRQDERHDIQTLELQDGKSLIEHLFNKGEAELGVICMIIYDTGSRIRAILKLRKRDIDSKGQYVYLTMEEKRGKIIRRLITRDTYERLRVECDLGNINDSNYLFLYDEDGRNLDSANVRTINKKYYESWSKLKNISRKYFGDMGVSFHWMRRGLGKDIYDKTGNDLIAVSEILGHDDPKTTKIYLKIQAQKAEDIIKKRKW